MKMQELQTPAILVREDIMERNLMTYQQQCSDSGKQLWPMLKTHKSTVFAARQRELGASGFLCGTLDECEALCAAGMDHLMYAYPVAGPVSCRRAAALAKACTFYVRLDTVESACQLNTAAREAGAVVNYTVILDCGLHRFGLPANEIAAFVQSLQSLENLRFKGISTHCGHVYAESDPEKVPLYAQQEREAVHCAVTALEEAGFTVELVTSGATPTFRHTLADEHIGVYHPGNYIFHDAIQLSNGTAKEADCALMVYATIISAPRPGTLICDAGAKCLGLDQGAHGNSSLKGHGYVIGHPELTLTALSEEVGKIAVEGVTDLRVGDRICIIPNHACSAANLTDHYILVNGEDNVLRTVPVDIRSNATRKGF